VTSSENVELIRRFYEGWSRGDMDAVSECVHDEMEFDWLNAMGPFKGAYHGAQGLAQFWRDMSDAWDQFAPEVEEVIESEGERLVVVSVVRARGKGSGIEVEARGGMLFTVRDGKILKGKFFQTKAEALAAAALPV
jgi:ketosteroid isomerase-like protein